MILKNKPDAITCAAFINRSYKKRMSERWNWEGVGFFLMTCFPYVLSRTRTYCCAAPCGAARGPFDHFEIRVSTLRFELARISKWSNGSRVAPHGVARQQIWFRIKPSPCYDFRHLHTDFIRKVKLKKHFFLTSIKILMSPCTWLKCNRASPGLVL
jgi:hypothetical protein